MNIIYLSLIITVLGIIINFVVFATRELTTLRASIVKLREDQERENADLRRDLTGIGEKVRQSESKTWYLAWTLCPEKDRKEVLNALVRRLS